MTNLVRFELNGKPAMVSFISRYRDENQYELTQDGKSGRIAKFDDGRISAGNSTLWTEADAHAAIAAYEAHEAQAFAEWAQKHPHIVNA